MSDVETKRKYAHKFYPHGGEYEVRPLAIEVPYLYARAIGLRLTGTGWFDAPWRDNEWAREASTTRTVLLIEADSKALLADALLQGLSGDEAWEWASSRYDDEGSWVYQRALHYGVDPLAIKPYPCGPEPDHHDHYGEADAHGWRNVLRAEGKESECADCCEPEAGEPA